MLRNLFLTLAGSAALALLMFAFYVRHKKQSSAEVILIGRCGYITQRLEPEGAVIVDGELWRAATSDGDFIAPGRQVRVCGVRGHLLVVEVV